MEKRFFEEKKVEEVFVDEARNRAENFQKLCEDYQPSRFERFVNGLREKFKPMFKVAVPVVLATTMATVFVACTPKEQTPETPKKPDTAETPNTPEQPNNPDSPSQPENPNNPNEPDDPMVDPDEPVVDYDKLTPETMTAEQKQTFITNVTSALQKNIQRTIGNNGVLNKLMAIDFKDDKINLLLDYTNSNGNTFGLFQYTMKDTVSYKSIFTGNIQPKSNTASGKGLCIIEKESHVNENSTLNILKKISDIEDLSDFDIATIATSALQSDGNFYRARIYTIYLLNENGLTTFSVHADGYNIDDPINDSILNGTEGVTYFIHEEESYKYNFSSKSMYDFDGL